MLLGTTLLVYAPALDGEFLLDDDVHVTAPELRSIAGLARIWSEPGATQQYYPVLHTAFWVEHRLWGDAVVGYHLANVLQHVLAAWLVVLLMRRLELPGGWLAAFAFALHPVCVESVAWIAEQKNTLSGAFALAAAVGYLRFDRDRSAGRYAMASALFLLALLSKTAMASLPPVLLVIQWWRHGRLGWKRDGLPLLPWFAAALVFGAITIAVEQRLIAGIGTTLAWSGTERWLIAGRALWFYLWNVVWPARLTFYYERWDVTAAGLWLHVLPLGWLVLGSALGAWGRRRRGPFAAYLVFTLTLFPVLGFIDVEWFVFSFVADHFLYVASLAVIVPLAAVTGVIAGAMSMRAPAVAKVAAAASISALAVVSWGEAARFRDNATLYADAVARSPRSVVAHHHLGVALEKIPGRRPDAIAAFEAALALNPDAAEVHANVGAALWQMPGRAADAAQHLEKAFQLKPALTGVRAKLAAAHFDLGKVRAAEPGAAAEAVAHYERALQLQPNFAEAHYNLGNLLLREPPRSGEALGHFETAVRLKPDFAEAHTNLGVLLARDPRRLPEAIAHFEAAVRANPEFAPARNNLANARRAAGGAAGEPR